MKIFYDFFKAIHFSGIFLGICICALIVEFLLLLDLRISVLQFPFYFLCLCAVSSYYLFLHLYDKNSVYESEHSNWISQYRKRLKFLLCFMLMSIGFCLVKLSFLIKSKIHAIPLELYLFLCFAILIAIFYTGMQVRRMLKFNLRQFALAKPFLIAFVWAVASVTIPVLFSVLTTNDFLYSRQIYYLCFFQNFLFIWILAVLYDAKDIARDSQNGLFTLNARYPASALFFYFLLPCIFLFAITSISVLLFQKLDFYKIVIIVLLISAAMVGLSRLIYRPTLYWYHSFMIDAMILCKAIVVILVLLKN